MDILAAIILTIVALLGVVLTFITLPGTWVAVAVALLIKLWRPELIGWWPLGVSIGLAVLAEVAEGLAASAGSAKSGGTRWGAGGALIGSIAGLMAGTVLIPLPILGSIIGAVVGAGLGAFIAERGISQRTWVDSWRSGRGAMVGRVLASVVKGLFALLIAAVLIVAAWVP